MPPDLMERLGSVLKRTEEVAGRRDILNGFGTVYADLRRQMASPTVPARVRERLSAFVALIDEAFLRLGDAIFQPSYLLNVVGEAMVRTDMVSGVVVEWLQVAVYFHGLGQIERRFASHATVYLALHGDLMMAFTGREALTAMVKHGQAKLADGKVFCLTYYYLNLLRKKFWEHHRKAEDALDHTSVDVAAIDTPAVATGGDEQLANWDPADRVGMMLQIFATRLTATQQRVYLAKNRNGESVAAAASAAAVPDRLLVDLLKGLDAELAGHGNLGWSEIAARLAVNEKTAKREYLRALHTLLSDSARAVFGVEIKSNYVKRTLAQLREIVYAKDLRIRSNSGDGLNRLVERWEVALRFVLNHQRQTA